MGVVADPGILTAVDKLDVRTATLARAGRGDYWRWLAHAQTAAACARPVRLAGTVDTWRRARAAASRLERAGAVDLVDVHDQHTTDVMTELTYVGIGWHTTADALLANTAAAMAREKRHAAARV